MQLADKFNESSRRAENAALSMQEASKRMANRY
jgi:hypothetical protein